MNTTPFDKTVEVEVTIAVAIFLTTIGVFLHEGSRRIRKARLTAYDFLLYFAYVDVLAKDIIALWLVIEGACSDTALTSQGPDAEKMFDNVFFALAGLRAATTISVKVAVLFLYKQVFTLDSPSFRIAWWMCLLYLVPCFLTIDLTFYGIIFANTKRTPHVEYTDFPFARIAHMIIAWLNTLADMSILCLPLPYLWRMRMQRSQKAALGVLLGIGFLATAGTWANAVLLSVALTKGIGYGMSHAFANTVLLIAAVVECATGIVCACLATSKPAISAVWTWLKAVSHREENYGVFTKLRLGAEKPEAPLDLAGLPVKEIAPVRSKSCGEKGNA